MFGPPADCAGKSAAYQSVLRMAFREWFGLSPAEADILVALYTAGGQFIQTDDVLPAHYAPFTLRQRVMNLRRALEVEAIDFVRGCGYRLTDVGLAECQRAIEEVKAALREAA